MWFPFSFQNDFRVSRTLIRIPSADSHGLRHRPHRHPPSFPRILSLLRPALPVPPCPSSSSSLFFTILGLSMAIDGISARTGQRVRASLPHFSFRSLVSCRLPMALFPRRSWSMGSAQAFGGIDQLVSLLDISRLSRFMVIFRPFPHACTLKPLSRLECRAQSPIYSCICFLSIIVLVVPSQCRSFVVWRPVVVEKIFRQLPCFRSHVPRTRHTSPWPRTRGSSTSATSPSMNCASPHHFLSLRVLHTLGRLRYTRHCIYARHLHSSDSLSPSSLGT